MWPYEGLVTKRREPKFQLPSSNGLEVRADRNPVTLALEVDHVTGLRVRKVLHRIEGVYFVSPNQSPEQNQSGALIISFLRMP